MIKEWYVESSTIAGVYYRVELNTEAQTLTCSCQAGRHRPERACKHMVTLLKEMGINA